MFAVIPSLYLETKLRTNSATASGQTPPKQTVATTYPRTTSQQRTPNQISPSLDKNIEVTSTEVYSGT